MVVEGEEDESIFTKDEREADSKVCSKCSLADVFVVLRSDGSYCRSCFIARIAHKFRSEFGKARIIRDHEEVLVAYSGGPSSSAMVHLIQEGLSKRAQKKLRFNPNLVFIIEKITTSEEKEFVMEVVKRMDQSGLRYYVYNLDQIYNSELQPLICNTRDDPTFNLETVLSRILVNGEKNEELFKSVRSRTSQEAFQSLISTELLIRISRQLHYSKILSGETATKLAARLLSHIAQGRGAQLSYAMEFVDTRYKDVLIVHPLRFETSSAFQRLKCLEERQGDLWNNQPKELHNQRNRDMEWSEWHRGRPGKLEELLKLLNMYSLKLATSVGFNTSIDRVTQEFVDNLQMENENTLTIICRTGEKLAAPTDSSENETIQSCCLCRAPIEAASTVSSARAATEISVDLCQRLQEQHLGDNTNDTSVSVSQNYPAQPADDTCVRSASCIDGSMDEVCNGDDCCRQKNPRLTTSDLLSCLCYGCRLIAKEMADVNKLPQCILQEVQQEVNRIRMKSSIQSYLLEDEDS